jgi:hypothetical protein
VVDQTVIDDDRLSLAGRGLLVTLLSKPDDWQVRVSDLRRRCRCRVGRDYVYKLLGDLGYVRYELNRTPSGRMAGGTYYVHERPNESPAIGPHTDLPEAAGPNTAAPEAIPNTKRDLRTTTTQIESGGGHEACAEELIFPNGLLDAERPQAEKLVAELSESLRQPVLDELAGLMKAGKVREVPLACLRGIVRKAKAGAFTPDRALRIAQAREERRRAEDSYARARERKPDFGNR